MMKNIKLRKRDERFYRDLVLFTTGCRAGISIGRGQLLLHQEGHPCNVFERHACAAHDRTQWVVRHVNMQLNLVGNTPI